MIATVDELFEDRWKVVKPERTVLVGVNVDESLLTEGGELIELSRVRRIAIIGPCGSGKSTLARELSGRTNLPVYHLDRLYWKPGWVESTREEFREVQSGLVERQEWIIDGNYGNTFDLRMPRADLVIYLDFPRHIYLRRVIWRTLSGLGRTREDLAENCPERFDFTFIRFVWNIPKKSRPRTLAGLQRHNVAPRLIRLSGPRAVRRFLEGVRVR